jgi:hypothetical protein
MNGGVGIQLSDTGRSDLVAGLADVLSTEEELGGEIRDGGGRGVVEGEALDAGKGDILCDLDTESLQTDDQDVGCAHALHSLVTQHIELATVQGLVDLGAHAGD